MKATTKLTCLFAAFAFCACSETEDIDSTYANWQARNDAFFAGIYQQASDSISANRGNWKRIKSVTKDSSEGTMTDYIVVKVLKVGDNTTDGSPSPYQNDSVRVHYRGCMINTAYQSPAQVSSEYANGYYFDSTWQGDYNLATMVPTKFAVSGLINGFTTALQHMHTGDRWQVFIPYNLGYGGSASGNIQPYSTLVFDITLQAFARAGNPLPPYVVK